MHKEWILYYDKTLKMSKILMINYIKLYKIYQKCILIKGNHIHKFFLMNLDSFLKSLPYSKLT